MNEQRVETSPVKVTVDSFIPTRTWLSVFFRLTGRAGVAWRQAIRGPHDFQYQDYTTSYSALRGQAHPHRPVPVAARLVPAYGDQPRLPSRHRADH